MKNRNLILSLAVLLASIGTALASTFYVTVPTYVHGFKQVIGGDPTETCSTLGNKCEGGVTGPNCVIQVSISGGGTDNTPGYGAASGVECSMPLKHTSSTPLNDGVSTIFTEVD
jgi:hypothetical protein